MKAVAVNGSPRKQGNTHLLLEKVLEPLREAGWETELVQLGGRNIHGCRACNRCFDKKDLSCDHRDDVFNEVAAKLFSADALILGSPTYFTDVSAEMKALLDRLGFVSIANGGVLRGRIGAAVVAVRRGGGTHVFDTINHMFLMSGVIVPGSSYWNLGFGLEPGGAARDEEGLANMRHLGATIRWLGAALEGRRKSFPPPPGEKEG
ncbi:MAG TPA: flavodoxin family protein [Myxococcales bacterium]|jgi:multimeric flavodoxin WrbA